MELEVLEVKKFTQYDGVSVVAGESWKKPEDPPQAKVEIFGIVTYETVDSVLFKRPGYASGLQALPVRVFLREYNPFRG